MTSVRKLTILLTLCFLGTFAIPTYGQNAMPTPMEDVNGMPTPIVGSREVHLTRQEIGDKFPDFSTGLSRTIHKDEGLNLDSEKITYRDDVGYIFRYEILHASPEEVDKNPSLRSFLVLWTKEFKKFNVATYSGYDFQNPL